MDVLKFLRGKKTYIQVGAALLVVGLHLVGIMDDGSTARALVVLGFGSLATLRSGITNALAQAKADAAAVK